MSRNPDCVISGRHTCAIDLPRPLCRTCGMHMVMLGDRDWRMWKCPADQDHLLCTFLDYDRWPKETTREPV